ncbi:MAG: 6,7-dimethyl-8-ribityllumazine synthase [Caulobacteraceae bacterium]
MTDRPLRVLIVEARFYDALADALLAGAADALTAFGATFEVITVPGALEIPAVVAMAADDYDGFVALGCVIRGETWHFEIVSNQSARGLMDLAIARGLAIGNGILTVEDEDQAWARARLSEGDKGGGAARACLEMIAIKRRMAAAS